MGGPIDLDYDTLLELSLDLFDEIESFFEPNLLCKTLVDTPITFLVYGDVWFLGKFTFIND